MKTHIAGTVVALAVLAFPPFVHLTPAGRLSCAGGWIFAVPTYRTQFSEFACAIDWPTLAVRVAIVALCWVLAWSIPKR